LRWTIQAGHTEADFERLIGVITAIVPPASLE
jgi:hypothetical protein